MNERIHELNAEIRTIEQMLDSLSGPMHQLALEEQQNLQFELDMLERNIRNHETAPFKFEHQQHEA